MLFPANLLTSTESYWRAADTSHTVP